MAEVLQLTEDLFLGKGLHKKCFRHPSDASKCVKVAYSADGRKDLERDVAYAKLLRARGGDEVSSQNTLRPCGPIWARGMFMN